MPDYFDVDFDGTASRRIFWKNQLACIGTVGALLALLFVATFALGTAGLVLATVAMLLGVVYCTVSAYAIGARRCRDIGHSGWMVLLYLVPLVGLPFMLYLGFARGRPSSVEC